MSKQLNLRVDEKFAEQLESLSKKLGRSMTSVLETIARPAIEATEADLKFEKEALKAWEKYQLTGTHVTTEQINDHFKKAHNQASIATEKGAEWPEK